MLYWYDTSMSQILTAIGIILAIGGAVWIGLWAMRLRADWKREEELVFLQLLVPKKETREEKDSDTDQFGKDYKEVIGVMDHLYQSLHGLYNSSLNRYWHGEPFFSVEYAALAGEILFFVVCPRHIAPLIEKQITSFYPETIIDEVEDYNIFTQDSVHTRRYSKRISS
jgi:hypothetical protein